MTDLKLNIDNDQMKAMVSEGILAQLTDEAKTDILKQAVKWLLTPAKSQYGQPEPSPLQLAYNDAVREVLRVTVREIVEADPEFKQKIREAVGDALLTMHNDYKGLQEKIAEAVGQIVLDGWKPKDW